MSDEIQIPLGTPVATMTGPPQIFLRMAAILNDLPPVGKNQKNAEQHFSFRGIDDVMVQLNPLLAKHGVFYVPTVLERVEEKRAMRGDRVMHCVHLHVRYRFYAADGSYVDADGWGEGTDMGDKATPKAMTGAMKYVLFQTFAISVAEAASSDGDHHTPEETVHRSGPPPRRWGDAAQNLIDRMNALPHKQREACKQQVRDEHGLPEGWRVADVDPVVAEYEKQAAEAQLSMRDSQPDHHEPPPDANAQKVALGGVREQLGKKR